MPASVIIKRHASLASLMSNSQKQTDGLTETVRLLDTGPKSCLVPMERFSYPGQSKSLISLIR
jgi:hypothetical protein